jgi:hypothetical protein
MVVYSSCFNSLDIGGASQVFSFFGRKEKRAILIGPTHPKKKNLKLLRLPTIEGSIGG